MGLRRGLFGPWGRVAKAIRRAICKGPRPTDSSTYWQCSPAKCGDWDSPNEGFVQGWCVRCGQPMLANMGCARVPGDPAPACEEPGPDRENSTESSGGMWARWTRRSRGRVVGASRPVVVLTPRTLLEGPAGPGVAMA